MANNDSYCLSVKKEAAKTQYGPDKLCCIRAETYGLLLFSRLLTKDEAVFKTEHLITALRIAEMTASCCGVYVQITEPSKLGGLMLYSVSIPEQSQRESVFGFFGDAACNVHNISGDLLQNSCCADAFLRGAFMVCGSVTDPNKEYHIEFTVPEKSLCGDFCAFLAKFGIKVNMIQRKNSFCAYSKDSEQILEVLGSIGAGNAYYDLMQLKIQRSFKNGVNRRVNCDIANTTKTVSAASAQIDAIKYIEREKGLDFLPDELRRLALLRLENPELSLNDIVRISPEPITKSGVNHRLRRIISIAEEIRKDNR